MNPSDPPPQGQPAAKPPKDVPASRLAQQLREEGWNLQTSESLTLAEVYLMMGKPSKLQLEYDWLAVLGPEGQAPGGQAQGPHTGPPPPTFHKQRLLSCLLRLISTEVNPRLVSGGRGTAQGHPGGEGGGDPGDRAGHVSFPRAGLCQEGSGSRQAWVLSHVAHTRLQRRQ